MKHIAIIEPSSSGLALIEEAKKLGHTVTVLTFNQNDRLIEPHVLKNADHVCIVDTHNALQCSSCIREIDARHSLSAILPGFEYFVPLATYLNHLLGLPGLDPKKVGAVRFKDDMAQAIQEQGLRVPRFWVIEESKDLEKYRSEFTFPCVIKPVDGSGSIDVKKIESYLQLKEFYKQVTAFKKIDMGMTFRQAYLVQEYIAGKEYSAEGLVTDQGVKILSVTEKLLGQEPYFVELGHIVRAQLNTTQQQTVENYVKGVVKATGISMGPFHCEFRLSSEGPVVMEIAARLAGDHICDLIQKATGINLYESMIRSYLGETILWPTLRQKYAGISFFQRSISRYNQVEGLDRLQQIQHFDKWHLNYQRGEAIPQNQDFSSRIGYAIFSGDDYQEVKTAVSLADQAVKFLEKKELS